MAAGRTGNLRQHRLDRGQFLRFVIVGEFGGTETRFRRLLPRRNFALQLDQLPALWQ